MQFILFDVEATCWDGYHSNKSQEIIELAALLMDRYGERRDTFESLIRPVINPRLSHYCRTLTNIRQPEVDRAPSFEEVYEDFEAWSDPDSDTYFVAWGKFDYEIMEEECQRSFDTPSVIDNYIDFQALYTSLKELPPRLSLIKALENEEMDFEGSVHRALPDTLNMARLFDRYFDIRYIS